MQVLDKRPGKGGRSRTIAIGDHQNDIDAKLVAISGEAGRSL